jgi:hypothetical protein
LYTGVGCNVVDTEGKCISSGLKASQDEFVGLSNHLGRQQPSQKITAAVLMTTAAVGDFLCPRLMSTTLIRCNVPGGGCT